MLWLNSFGLHCSSYCVIWKIHNVFVRKSHSTVRLWIPGLYSYSVIQSSSSKNRNPGIQSIRELFAFRISNLNPFPTTPAIQFLIPILQCGWITKTELHTQSVSLCPGSLRINCQSLEHHFLSLFTDSHKCYNIYCTHFHIQKMSYKIRLILRQCDHRNYFKFRIDRKAQTSLGRLWFLLDLILKESRSVFIKHGLLHKSNE